MTEGVALCVVPDAVSILPGVRVTVPAWKELCRRCNELYAVPDSWWRTVLADPEVIVRVDRDAVSLRLRGNLLLRVELRGRGLHCRVPSEYLLRRHPGSLSVLCEEASPAPPCVSSLNELGADYALVRRRACQVTDRRRAVQDRLFLRHGVFLAVDAPLPPGNADLLAVHPGGAGVVFLLRRYADADLRLAGPGGVAHCLARWREWLQGGAAKAHVTELAERLRSLHGPFGRRFERFPEVRRMVVRPRLLLVDFDHAQRLGGLDALCGALMKLDPELERNDILAIGDPGNISVKTLFSGLEADPAENSGQEYQGG